MASVGGSLTWEAEDLEGELCLGAGVGATGEDRLSETPVPKCMTDMTDRQTVEALT